MSQQSFSILHAMASSFSFFDAYTASLTAVLAAYAIIGFGVLARFKAWISRSAQQQFLAILINWLMPCFIFDRVAYSSAFSDIRNLLQPPVLGFFMAAAGIAFSWLCVRVLPAYLTGLQNGKEQRTFSACVGNVNYGFVPIPLVSVLFLGDERLFGVLMVQNLGVEFAVWTITIFTMMGKLGSDSWRKAINGPTIAIFLAASVNIFSHSSSYPQILNSVTPFFAPIKLSVSLFGTLAIPLSMILVGCTIADYLDTCHITQRLGKTLRISFFSCLIRIGILPPFFILLSVFVLGRFCSVEIQKIVIIHASMASAVFPIVLSELYEGDPDVALVTILSNSLLAIFTSPLWIAVGLKFIA